MAGRGDETPWEAVTAIGAAIAAEREMPAAVGVATRRLAALCDATVALWGAIDGPDRLRLLAVSPLADGQVLPAIVSTSPGADGRQPAAFAALPRALATRSPVVGAEDDGPGAYLAVPLPAQGRAWGVALARASRPVDELLPCCGPLEALAPLLGLLLAGAARDAARPNERSGGEGGRDDWPQLRDVIERELARARRERSSCAVVLVALAPVEMTQPPRAHGGPALDEEGRQAMLRLFRATCRAMDLVSRYGTDQFLALLPGSDGRGARLAADRFLRQLYLSPVGLPPDRSGYLQATIGIAAFPVDGFTADELLSTASTALCEQRRAVGSRR